MNKPELIQYEKIITVNDQSFNIIHQMMQRLLFFINDKCQKDAETLEYFQCNLTDSERSPFSKDLKIKWAVTKNKED
jgi:hypothetical protein